MVLDCGRHWRWRNARQVWGRGSLKPLSEELDRVAQELLVQLQRDHPLPRAPRLEWRPFRTSAGRACYSDWRIDLGVRVLDTQQKVRDTLIHEFAHLLAYARVGRRGWGHGAAWQRAMADLGAPAEVYHTYPVKRNKPRQAVQYRCTRCGSTFVRLRALPKRRRYAHMHCGGGLELVKRAPLTEFLVEA